MIDEMLDVLWLDCDKVTSYERPAWWVIATVWLEWRDGDI